MDTKVEKEHLLNSLSPPYLLLSPTFSIHATALHPWAKQELVPRLLAKQEMVAAARK
jgi:hypothetical protein